METTDDDNSFHPSRYDPTLEDLVNNPDAELQELCNGDIGCLIDGEALGLEAAQNFLVNPAILREEVSDTTYPPTASTAPSQAPSQAPTQPGQEFAWIPPKTCKASGYGDPHLNTFDHLRYDVHARGEVIMLQSLDSDLMVQARFEKAGARPGNPASKSP